MNDPDAELLSFYERIRNLFVSRRHTDVCVTCNDGTVFFCHRLALVAASEYLDERLQNLNRTSHATHVGVGLDICGATFAFLLQYIYSGRVDFLDDRNVDNIYEASLTLRMESVTKACLKYRFSKRMPEQSATEIFEQACETRRTALPATPSWFSDRSLPNVPTTADFNTLSNSDLIAEQTKLMEMIIERTVELSLTEARSTGRVKSNNAETASARRFKYSAPYDSTQSFAKKRSVDCETMACLESVPWDVSHMSGVPLALHMFTQTPGSEPLKVSTLARKGDAWTTRSLDLPAGVQDLHELRCTMIGDHVFWLLSHLQVGLTFGQDYSIKFRVSRSINLSTDSRWLPEPFRHLSPESSLRMCSDGRSTVFACADNSNTVSRYNYQVNRWSHSNLGGNFFVRAMTWHQSQLYVVGAQSVLHRTQFIRAYDPRCSTYNAVMHYETDNPANFECIGHQERLYVASTLEKPSNICIVDPTASRRIQRVPVAAPYGNVFHECRFASLPDAMWTFFCNNYRPIQVGLWGRNYVTTGEIPVQSPNCYPHDLLDVVVYKNSN